MPNKGEKGLALNFLFSQSKKSLNTLLNKSISGKILNTFENPSYQLYNLFCHPINMSVEQVIDLLNSKFDKSEKSFGEISGQLAHHRETMSKIEKELTTRVQANTIQLNDTIAIATSNSARVEAAESGIADLKAENRELKGEVEELKTSVKKVVADNLDIFRRSYKK